VSARRLQLIGVSRWIATFGAPMLLLTLALPLIRAQRFSTNDAFDEVNYHRPIIATMAAEFPAVDVVNYNAAMSPGYHVAMASVLHFSGSWAAVRGANLAIGVLLVALAGCVAWRLSHASSAALTTLTLAASSYVLSGSVWLTTDNFGLLLAMASLSALLVGRATVSRSLASGVTGALSALVRQIHVWTAVPIAASTLWSPPVQTGLPPSRKASANRGRLGVGDRPGHASAGDRTTARLLESLAPAALPIAAVGSLVLLWGGLLPPRFVGHHGGWNIAAIVFGFGLIGVYGWPWLLLAWSDAPRALTGRSGAMVFLVLALALMVPSSYEVEAGRWGGWLWEAVRRTPTVLNRSVLLTVFAVVGALTLATLAHGALDRGRKREMGLLVVALVAWMATQSANFQVWQRYFEPAILIFLSWLIALAPPPLDHGRWLLPLAVATAALAATILLVHGDVYGFLYAR